MMAKIKSFLLGLLLGSVIAFLLGMNYGRDLPLFSNPFAERSLAHSVKHTAGALVDEAREKIHEATKPEPVKR